jgi:hypothetical protein
MFYDTEANMTNENQTKSCFGIRKAVKRIAESDAPEHLGNALREVLLAVRSAVDAAIESKEQQDEAKFQKVTIE